MSIGCICREGDFHAVLLPSRKSPKMGGSLPLGLVAAAELSGEKVRHLLLDELLAERGNTVGKDLSFEMVELVLHHSSQISFQIGRAHV